MISVVVGSSPVAVTGTFVMKPLPVQEDADPPEFCIQFQIFALESLNSQTVP